MTPQPPAPVPRAAVAWGLLYAAVQSAWAVTGTTVPLTPEVAYPPAAQFLLAAFALVAAVACAAVTRPLRHRARAAATAVLSAAPPVFAAGALSLPVHLVTLLSGAGVESATGLACVLLDAAGAAVLAHGLTTGLRRLRGQCARCGRAHPYAGGGPLTHPGPSTATRRTRTAAALLLCGVLPWAGVKTIWTLGGDALGVTAERWHAANAGAPGAARALASVGVDVTVLAALLAVVLTLGLLHRWGTVFPRWTPLVAGLRVPRMLPLVPAWAVGAGLAAYGSVLVVYASLRALGVLPSAASPDGFTRAGLTWMILFGGLAFAGLGYGLLLSARSYAARTRPTCAPPPAPVAGGPGRAVVRP
ncbi:hypothetical protein [Nonomuraea sp. NPDC005501]|uniref:hypothetical protein n=1 Tax=Nonomuraea sp. NPDC005501 TaxID=3156884 RepID=UPI0033A7B6AE